MGRSKAGEHTLDRKKVDGHVRRHCGRQWICNFVKGVGSNQGYVTIAPEAGQKNVAQDRQQPRPEIGAGLPLMHAADSPE
jgi:hypothetical protein